MVQQPTVTTQDLCAGVNDKHWAYDIASGQSGSAMWETSTRIVRYVVVHVHLFGNLVSGRGGRWVALTR